MKFNFGIKCRKFFLSFNYKRQPCFKDSLLGINVVALVNRFPTVSVKYRTAKFCIYASSNGPVIILNGLKLIDNSRIPFTPVFR